MALHQQDPEPSQTLDRHGYLFGKKISKSMSPELHDVIYAELGLRWAQTRLDSDDIAQFLEILKQPETYGEKRHYTTMMLSTNYFQAHP